MPPHPRHLSSLRAPPREDTARLLAWVERVALFLNEEFGLPPISGRVLGWLMVCSPPEQSGAEIAEAIGASRASITTNIRLLGARELIRRQTRTGQHTVYHVVSDDAWEKLIRRSVETIASFREVTEDGIQLLGPRSSRADRIRTAHDAFEFFAALVADAPSVSRTRARD